MQSVLIFVDEANFAGTAIGVQRKPDLIALRDYLANPEDGRSLVEMVVYMGFPPQVPESSMPAEWKKKRDSKIRQRDFLQYSGIMTVTHFGKGHQNTPESLTCNIDVLMAMDAVEMALEIRPDIVVLVTGDADFSYLSQKLRRRGIRVEVASLKKNCSGELEKSVNSFIDLTDFFNAMPGPRIGDADSFFDSH
jgi:uncharacterized LabA/DUF88 family protein